MANVAVRNWRFLNKLGITGCRWFDGFGTELSVYRRATIGDVEETLSPDSPTVLTLKVLFQSPGLPTREQVCVARGNARNLLHGIRATHPRAVHADVLEGGFNPRRDIAAIILNRWGMPI